MKILHIGKYFSPFSGGLENYMRDAMVALERRGIRTAALVHRHSFSWSSDDEVFSAGGHDFRVLRAAVWANFLYTPISPGFPRQLLRIVRSFKPDVLHLHLPNPSAFWALGMPSARRIPWVVHWHSDVITTQQDRLMKFFYQLYRPFEYAVLKRANAIIATSSPYMDSSEPLRPWRDKCHVVPLGVDTARFEFGNEKIVQRDSDQAPQTRPLPEIQTPTSPGLQPLRILAVGRLTYYKGFSYLLEAAARVENVRVELVGHGDQADDLKALTASLKLQDRVTFHGILSDRELATQMQRCDCLCLPSIERTEAFGMVLLEAMYFGKATIVSDVAGSGMGWIIDDGITGIKVKAADHEALANALVRLSANREELEKMAQRGKAKFDKQFEINHAISGLIDVYQLALSAENENSEKVQTHDDQAR